MNSMTAWSDKCLSFEGLMFLAARTFVSCAKEEDEFSDTRTEEEVADSTSSEVTISVDYDDEWIVNEYSY